MKIHSCLAQGYQKAIADTNQNFWKKLIKFASVNVSSKKNHLHKNEPAIKYTEGGSAEQEKDVLLKHYSIKMSNNEFLIN